MNRRSRNILLIGGIFLLGLLRVRTAFAFPEGNLQAQELGDVPYRSLRLFGVDVHAAIISGIKPFPFWVDLTDKNNIYLLEMLNRPSPGGITGDYDSLASFMNTGWFGYWGSFTHGQRPAIPDRVQFAACMRWLRDMRGVQYVPNALNTYVVWNNVDPLDITSVSSLRSDAAVEYCYTSNTYPIVLEPDAQWSYWTFIDQPTLFQSAAALPWTDPGVLLPSTQQRLMAPSLNDPPLMRVLAVDQGNKSIPPGGATGSYKIGVRVFDWWSGPGLLELWQGDIAPGGKPLGFTYAMLGVSQWADFDSGNIPQLANLPEGWYTLRAFDAAGNTGVPSLYKFKVQRQPIAALSFFNPDGSAAQAVTIPNSTNPNPPFLPINVTAHRLTVVISDPVNGLSAYKLTRGGTVIDSRTYNPLLDTEDTPSGTSPGGLYDLKNGSYQLEVTNGLGVTTKYQFIIQSMPVSLNLWDGALRSSSRYSSGFLSKVSLKVATSGPTPLGTIDYYDRANNSLIESISPAGDYQGTYQFSTEEQSVIGQPARNFTVLVKDTSNPPNQTQFDFSLGTVGGSRNETFGPTGSGYTSIVADNFDYATPSAFGAVVLTAYGRSGGMTFGGTATCPHDVSGASGVHNEYKVKSGPTPDSLGGWVTYASLVVNEVSCQSWDCTPPEVGQICSDQISFTYPNGQTLPVGRFMQYQVDQTGVSGLHGYPSAYMSELDAVFDMAYPTLAASPVTPLPFVVKSPTTIDGKPEMQLTGPDTDLSRQTLGPVQPSAISDKVAAAGKTQVSGAYNTSPGHPIFSSPATVQMAFSPQTVKALNVDPNSLQIFETDANGNFAALPGQTLDQSNSMISAKIGLLHSTFTILGSTLSVPVSGLGSGQAIAVDGSGNVWEVFGSTAQIGLGKYDSSGVFLSSAPIPTGSSAGPWAISFDTNGYVYALGTSSGPLTVMRDMAVYRISSSSVSLISSATFNSGYNLDDIAFDGGGDGWITGSIQTTSGLALALLRYNPQTGLVNLTTTYTNGAGFDLGSGLTVDNSGNVWVVGFSSNPTTSGASKLDLALWEFNSSGLLSTGPFRRAGYMTGADIRMGARVIFSSNTIIAAASRMNALGNTDLGLAAFNTSGTLLFEKAWHSASSSDETPRRMSVDSSSNVYVVGNSGQWMAFWEYSSTGTFLTAQTNPGFRFASGIAIQGTSTWLSLDASTVPVLASTAATLAGSEGLEGIPAPKGLYATGIGTTTITLAWNLSAGATYYLVQASTAPDFSGAITSTYSASSPATLFGLNPNTLYFLRVNALYGGDSSGFSDSLSALTFVSNGVGLAIGTDPSGNIWDVVGVPIQVSLQKFSASGVFVSSVPLPNAAQTGGWRVQFDSSGKAYAIGSSSGPRTVKNDMVVYVASATGNVWISSAIYNSPLNGDDIAYDATANGWITGTIPNAAGGLSLALLNYNPQTGLLSLTTSYTGPASMDAGLGISTDSTGNIWVIGFSSNPSTSGAAKLDLALWEFAPDGSSLLAGPFRQPGYMRDPDGRIGAKLVVSTNGPVAAASLLNSPGNTDLSISSYSFAGNLVSSHTWFSLGSFDESPLAITFGTNGNLLVAGRSGPAIALWTYTSTGAFVSATSPSGTAGYGFARGVTTNSSGTWISLSANTTPYLLTGGDSIPGAEGIDSGILSAPGGLSITSVFVSSLTAGWNPVFGAVSYRLDASTASDYTGTVFSSVTASTSASITNLFVSATYYARASASGSGKTSSYTASVSTFVPPVLGIASGLALAADSDGSLWAVVGTQQQVRVAKFTSSGTLSASTLLPYPSSTGGPWNLTFDSAGNAFAVGTASGPQTIMNDIAVYKVDSSGGILLSSVTYNNPMNGNDLSIDATGQAWVTTVGQTWITGQVPNSLGGVSLALLKLNPYSGLLNLTTTYTGPGGMDVGTGVATDASGNVWVVGYSSNPATSGADKLDMALWQFNSTGTALVSGPYRRAGYFSTLGDTRASAKITASSTTLSMAASYLNSLGNTDLAVVQIDNQGNLLSTHSWHSSNSTDEVPRRIISSPTGNLVIVGQSSSSIAIWTYSSTGTFISAATPGTGTVQGIALNTQGTWLALDSSTAPYRYTSGSSLSGGEGIDGGIGTLRLPNPAPLVASLADFYYRDIYAFPNPSRRNRGVTIRTQVGLADSINIHVYDISGQLVNQGSPGDPRLFDDGNGKGVQYTYDYKWGTGDVGSGVYIYSVTAKKGGNADIRKTKKVAITK